jgi:hypothetical protein
MGNIHSLIYTVYKVMEKIEHYIKEAELAFKEYAAKKHLK